MGWGAGAASMAGAARFRFASGLRAAACAFRPLCCRFPPRGAATAGAPCRWGSRWRFAAACGERRAGFAAMPHPTKGRLPCPEGAAERRRGMVRRWAERRPPGRRKAQGIPAAIGGEVREHQTERREGVPAGHSLLLHSKADRLTVGQVLSYPPPPLGKAPSIGHMQHRGETTQGFHPCTPGAYFM